MSTLVIGTGYVGTELVAALRSAGVDVLQTSRTPGCADRTVVHGAALDALLVEVPFDQVVVVGQLASPDIDWVLERIDGSRWLVLSSQQVTSAVTAPGTVAALAREQVALARNACVLRPTMVYGRGRDQNITRMIRLMQLMRMGIVPGFGAQLTQPLHVDDLIKLVMCHIVMPRGGLYPIGGSEALPVRELVGTVAEIIGIRSRPVELPSVVMRVGILVAPLAGVRSDQLKRLTESKTADITLARDAFGWEPAPLGIRLEQAVRELRVAAPVDASRFRRTRRFQGVRATISANFFKGVM